MKKNRLLLYISESLTGFGSLAMAILFFFTLYKLKTIYHFFGTLVTILMPLIYGAAIAFILSPMCNKIFDYLDQTLPANKLAGTKRKALINVISVSATMITALVVLYLLLVMMLPQLFDSIVNLINNSEQISNSFFAWVNSHLDSNPELQTRVLDAYNAVGNRLMDYLQNTLVPRIQDMVSGVSLGIIGAFIVLKNLIIGVIISIYLMFNRKLYTAQLKKLLYSVLPIRWANHIMKISRNSSNIFSGFLVGKLVDSAIIGVLCFIGVSFMKMPYPLLISTIIGITNIVPYFGPIVGAIPCVFLILTVNPLQSVYFAIFALALQTVDGNIIGPKILGNSTGLSSFWVLFSLLLFGGWFGFIGMVIGVPCFAVIYDLLENGVKFLLKRKKLPEGSITYANLDHIDPVTGDLIPMAGKSILSDPGASKADVDTEDFFFDDPIDPDEEM